MKAKKASSEDSPFSGLYYLQFNLSYASFRVLPAFGCQLFYSVVLSSRPVIFEPISSKNHEKGKDINWR
jgi:hypothetical protein